MRNQVAQRIRETGEPLRLRIKQLFEVSGEWMSRAKLDLPSRPRAYKLDDSIALERTKRRVYRSPAEQRSMGKFSRCQRRGGMG